MHISIFVYGTWGDIREATTNQTMRENARILGEKIQQEDGVAEAVKWIERFLAKQ